MARILLAANSSWNLQHFRSGLIASLLREGHEIVTVSPDLDGIRFLDQDLAHRRWSMNRSSLGPLGNIASLVRLIQLVRRERPDVFLGFTIKPNIYGAIACRLLRIPAVPNVSGLGTAFLGKSVLRAGIVKLYRFAFRQAPTVFFQNPDDERLFLEKKIVRPGQGRVLAGSGVNLHAFAARPLPSDLQFLMISRLLGDKGVREYVGAARLLCQQFPSARFLLLGDLDPHNRSAITKDELETWVAEGVIDYSGSTSDVRPFIESATAVVLPSYREGLPRTLLEGAAMGRPLVATDVPGCREVVREGVTGFLCEPRDIQSLAGAMKRLAKCSADERAAMGTRARQMAESRFDEELVFNAYSTVIEQVTTTSPG